MGPYDFMQMYMLSDTKGELSGDYYVQLQTVRLDSTNYYNNSKMAGKILIKSIGFQSGNVFFIHRQLILHVSRLLDLYRPSG